MLAAPALGAMPTKNRRIVLEKVDPEAGARARSRYACFDHFGGDTRVYGFATGTGLAKTCEEEVVSALVDRQQDVGRVLAIAQERKVIHGRKIWQPFRVRRAITS